MHSFQRSISSGLLALAMLVSTLFGIYPAHADQYSSPQKLAADVRNSFPDQLSAAVLEEIKEAVLSEPKGEDGNVEGLATLYLADRFYNKLGTGRFEGAPTIIWNAFDDDSERPTFFYPGSDFTYITADGRRITPGTMDTNGGSIPQILHSINRYSPWTYGPAFIIHDWIFVAHKCGAEPDSGIGFEESGVIMAEAIKTLMEVGFTNHDGETKRFTRNEDTLYLMYLAVISGIAENVWNDANTVGCR